MITRKADVGRIFEKRVSTPKKSLEVVALMLSKMVKPQVQM
jgi:hypothetical protein